MDLSAEARAGRGRRREKYDSIDDRTDWNADRKRDLLAFHDVG